MDADLVIRAQAGDREAFEALASAAVGRLRAVAWSILGDAALADDATQQALLGIWRGLPGLRDPARFEAWSYRFVVRACYAERRRVPRWLPNSRRDRPSRSPRTRSGSVEERDRLERAFRRLPMDHRAVVVLHHVADLQIDRVAEVLGIPRGTARSRLNRAMAGLRAALERRRKVVAPRSVRRGGRAMSIDRPTSRSGGWLRDRADAGSRPAPIVASVMAELDRVPQRRPRPWERRWGRDLPMSIPAPGYRWAGALGLIVVAVLALLVVVAFLAASRRHAALAARRPCGRSPRRRSWSRDGSHLAFVVDDQVPLAALASPVPSAPMTGDPSLVDISGCTPSPPTDRTFGSSPTGGSLGHATGCRPSPPTAVTCSSRPGHPTRSAPSVGTGGTCGSCPRPVRNRRWRSGPPGRKCGRRSTTCSRS